MKKIIIFTILSIAGQTQNIHCSSQEEFHKCMKTILLHNGATNPSKSDLDKAAEKCKQDFIKNMINLLTKKSQ